MIASGEAPVLTRVVGGDAVEPRKRMATAMTTSAVSATSRRGEAAAREAYFGLACKAVGHGRPAERR
jgi:hypothetical protein